MTTRPANPALEALLYTNNKRVCHLIKVTRKDGMVLLATDHDRILTYDGQKFRPVVLGALSADRRESGFRSGDQELKGVVDGTLVTPSDIKNGKFLGAEVQQLVVDWERPWVIFAAHRKWIRRIRRDGSSWIATIEGRTQALQRPSAGRFGGLFSVKCPYRLGGPFCKKDISSWTQMNAIVTGASTAATATTLTDSAETWTPGQLDGNRIILLSGTGSGQERTIIGTAVHSVTVDVPWTTIPPSPTNYRIGLGPEVDLVVNARTEFEFDDSIWVGTQEDDWYREGSVEWTSGLNQGDIHAVTSFVEDTKRIKLLIPTTNQIQVGDSAILRVGCDGLLTTCATKFNNEINFGGDPFAPSAQDIIEPPEEE